MKITIDEKICQQNDLTVEEVYMMLLIKSGINPSELLSKMEERKIIVKDPEDSALYLITQRWDDQLSTALLDAEDLNLSVERIDSLTKKLQNCFPEGKKAGTSHYWRGNKRDIALRLKKFFKLYGKTYTDEEIIKGAEEYVKSFNGQYSYMRILKYFIWKVERKPEEDGTLKLMEVSDLATYIENKDAENNTLKEDWTTNLT